jgi:undecaprenyl-diphosphatase
MTLTSIGRRSARSVRRIVVAADRWLQLTWRGYVCLFGACVAAGVSLLMFAAVGEDVVSRNGQFRNDPARLSWFVAHRDVLNVDTAKLLAIGGSVGMLLVFAGIAAIVLIWRRAPLALALTPIVALLAAGTVAGLVKALVDRARPAGALRLASESGASFPSGHATDTTAFVLATALVIAIVILRRPLARGATIAAAGLVSIAMAASRLLLGVHWPTDVEAGLTLGVGVALASVVAAMLSIRLLPSAGAHRAVALARLLRWTRADAPPGIVS